MNKLPEDASLTTGSSIVNHLHMTLKWFEFKRKWCIVFPPTPTPPLLLFLHHHHHHQLWQMGHGDRLIKPRFWVFISVLLLTQLIAPALSSRKWELFRRRIDVKEEKERTLIDPEGRLDIPSDEQALIDFANTNISNAHHSPQSGLIMGTCFVSWIEWHGGEFTDGWTRDRSSG